MASPQSRLFKPLTVGPVTLSSRIVMGPLGSTLADKNNILPASAIQYYGSRAQVPGTLIIGEATFVSAQAGGTPEPRAGIWTEEQITAWRAIVDEVHRSGSFIFLQLWALGRGADPEVKKSDGSGDVVSASAIPETEGGHVPRELSHDEILVYVRDYATAAKNAVDLAGFDGIELHGGNGSLIDQFTQDVVNRRDDEWGGSIENRSRFGIEIAKAVADAIGSQRVGFRVTPFSTYAGMGTPTAIPQFLHFVGELKKMNLAYIHFVESRIAGRVDVEEGESLSPFIDLWGDSSPILLAGGYSPDTAKKALDEEYRNKDVAIAFGRAFVNNADLVQRLKDGTPLREG